MAEIPDVVTLTTISSDWGNDIRDRTVQRYSSVANRTTEHPTPTEGDLSYLEDTNTVYVYDGTGWVSMFDPFGGVVRAGAAQDVSDSALTTSFVDFASVVFTKPTGWTTYALTAWATVLGIPAGGGSVTGRVEIGASNGTAVTPASQAVLDGAYITFGAVHSVTAQTASPVTVAAAVAEITANCNHKASTIQYIAYRLT